MQIKEFKRSHRNNANGLINHTAVESKITKTICIIISKEAPTAFIGKTINHFDTVEEDKIEFACH